jgi:hypothetical protein
MEAGAGDEASLPFIPRRACAPDESWRRRCAPALLEVTLKGEERPIYIPIPA